MTCKGIGEYRAITLTNDLNQTTGGVDNINGTSGDDLIVGAVNANPSYSLVDNINGGAGNDTLNLTINANTDAVNVSNVEKLLVRATAAATFEASGVTGATELVSYRSSADLSVKGLASTSVALGLDNSGDSDLDVLFNASAVTGTTDAVTLKLNGVVASAANQAQVMLDGVETVNIVTATADSKIGSVRSDNDGVAGIGGASTLTKVTVSGDKKVEVLTAFADTVVTVDASAQTAGGTLVGITAGKDVNVTGGAGNDQFKFLGATNLTAADTVNGGAGTDRVIVDENGFGTAALTKVTNVEEIGVEISATTSALNLNTSLISGVTTFYASLTDTANTGGINTLTLDKVTDAQSLVVLKASGTQSDGLDANHGNAIIVEHANDNETNTFTLTLAGIDNEDNDTTAVDAGLNSVQIDDAETLTINSNANATATVSKNLIKQLTSTDAKTITVTGAAALDIDAITAGNATSLDASAATGKLNIVFDSAKDRSIKLGTNDDTLSLGTTNAKTTVTGGAGNDKITLRSADLTADDVIDGGDGTDSLVISDDWVVNDIATAAAMAGLKNLEKVEMANDKDLTINDAFLGSFTGGSVTIARASGAAAQFVDSTAVLNSTSVITVDGSSQTGAGALNYLGSNGQDKYTGTLNADTVSMSYLTLQAADVFAGGAGADVFYIDVEGPATGTTSVTAAQTAGISSFNNVRISDSSGAENIGLTISDAFVSANASDNLLAFAAAAANGTESDDLTTFDASGVTQTSVSLYFDGSSDVDTFKGGAGNDIFKGDGGADKLILSAGGADHIHFTAANQGTDVITGFTLRGVATTAPTGLDKIVFTANDTGADTKAVLFSANEADDGGEVALQNTNAADASAGTVITVAANDYNEFAGVGTGGNSLADNKINVITTRGYSDLNAALLANGVVDDGSAGADALTDASFVVVFYNTSTQATEVYHVTDADSVANNGSITATATQLASFTDITLTGVAEFGADNFGVLALA